MTGTVKGTKQLTSSRTHTNAVSPQAGIDNCGGIRNTGGSTTSNNVTVETHTHSGVLPGGGDTQKPNGGA